MSVSKDIYYCNCSEREMVGYDRESEQVFCWSCGGLLKDIETQPDFTPESILDLALKAGAKHDKYLMEENDSY